MVKRERKTGRFLPWVASSLIALTVFAAGAEGPPSLQLGLYRTPQNASTQPIQLVWWSPNFEEPNYEPRGPFLAPVGTHVISRGKAVTSSIPPTKGKLVQIVDGEKGHEPENMVELPEGLQWVQIDLKRSCELWAIVIWHNFNGAQVYFDVIGEVSDDPEFKSGVIQFFNNDYDDSAILKVRNDKEYLEKHEGRLFDLQGHCARYVRFYGQGNARTSTTHFIEIEVWGKPSRTAPGDEKAPIEIELPEPFFGGLPL